MQLDEVMAALSKMGSDQTKKTYLRHGAREPIFGVKVGDMKQIVKKIKKDHALALSLFDTGNGDAMYLAGLIADAQAVTVQQLNRWAKAAQWYMISEYAVAGLAAESPHGWAVGLKWIESKQDHISAAGWATLSGVLSVRRDEELETAQIEALLDRVSTAIHNSSNRTRYAMNGFVIAAGSYVVSLKKEALSCAEAIGKVSVDMGDTACKVPLATAYIQKVIDKGRHGKKRKQAQC